MFLFTVINPVKGQKGVEVYIGQANKHAEFLGNLFLVGLNQTLGHKSRGVKYGNFQVLKETAYCPSVLLEMGFLSNEEEEAHIGKTTSISAYALLILETLIKYIGYD